MLEDTHCVKLTQVASRYLTSTNTLGLADSAAEGFQHVSRALGQIVAQATLVHALSVEKTA
jgi:hypothetical protein